MCQGRRGKHLLEGLERLALVEGDGDGGQVCEV